MILTLLCYRDLENASGQLPSLHKATGVNKKEKTDDLLDAYRYILKFKGTEYFQSQSALITDCYINGRFKNTALLQKLTVENKKHLYHFRIQTISGFIDLIFEDFNIRKKIGYAKYPTKEVSPQTLKPVTEDEKKKALSGDGFDRFLIMHRLYMTGDLDLLEIARNNLQFDEEHKNSCLYSAYLLGKLGDPTDIPKLWNLFLSIDNFFITESRCSTHDILIKRNILDSIELINYRST